MRSTIATHRGLDPTRQNYFLESSREAFEDQLTRGFGLEFDIQPTKDGGLAIIHDGSLKRLSQGRDIRAIRDVTTAELLSLDLNGCHLTDLPTLLALIDTTQAKGCISALHAKHQSQDPATLDILLRHLADANTKRFIIFDTTIENAEYLKRRMPSLHLAPSISHPYDIERYGSVTGGTLYPLDEILNQRSLFDWVWLDEWDLSDENGGEKNLYNQENIALLRAKEFSIGLVAPELHGTSPGLLGGEAHPDAHDKMTLVSRIKKIIALSPDLICTDYPDLVRKLILEENT